MSADGTYYGCQLVNTQSSTSCPTTTASTNCYAASADTQDIKFNVEFNLQQISMSCNVDFTGIVCSGTNQVSATINFEATCSSTLTQAQEDTIAGQVISEISKYYPNIAAAVFDYVTVPAQGTAKRSVYAQGFQVTSTNNNGSFGNTIVGGIMAILVCLIMLVLIV